MDTLYETSLIKDIVLTERKPTIEFNCLKEIIYIYIHVKFILSVMQYSVYLHISHNKCFVLGVLGKKKLGHTDRFDKLLKLFGGVLYIKCLDCQKILRC